MKYLIQSKYMEYIMSKLKMVSMIIIATGGKLSNFPLNISIDFILVVYNR